MYERNFIMKKKANQLSPRELCESKFQTSRYNLLLIIIMTLINIFILFIDASSYFVFSASIPYVIAIYGFYLTGKLPDDFYTDLTDPEFFPGMVLVILLVIALVILAFYFCCYIFSKKFKTGWIIAATVAFGLDTLFMVYYYGLSGDMALDYIFHALALYYLISGIIYSIKYKKLPEEKPATDEVEVWNYPDTTNSN